MSGGLFTTSSRLALILAAGLFAGGMNVTAAQAADLGGDCCADLEERVAELEATTVRHANRKITLSIAGRITQSVMYWNDGDASDIYQVNTDTDGATSRFVLSGKGKVNADVSVGYSLEIRAFNNRQSRANQDYVAEAGTGPLAVATETVTLESKAYGKLSLGYGSNSYRSLVAKTDLGGGSTVTATNYNQDYVGAFSVGNTRYANINQPFQIDRSMNVRYDSASVNGFVVSASWGDDDTVAATLTYDGKVGETAFKFGAGYNVNTTTAFTGVDDTRYTLAAAVYDAPSGLFANVEYNVATATDLALAAPGAALNAVGARGTLANNVNLAREEDATNIYFKGGWRQNVNGIGQTAIFADYSRTEGAYQARQTVALGVTEVRSVDSEMYGVGIAQDIDAVGATMFLNYKKFTNEDNGTGAGLINCGPTGTSLKCDDLDTVLAGMVVNF
jgi:hypothetical protein